jgi:hypothetical protein
MADHIVQVNYTDSGTFTPTPNPVRVQAGQTITFKLVDGPPNGKLRITFHDPRFFSAAQFHDGGGNIHVTAEPTPTTYHCELLVDGKVVAQSHEHTGGDIVPDITP